LAWRFVGCASIFGVASLYVKILAMMFHPFQCCKFLHGEFFDCVCILNVASFSMDIFNHNVNGLPKQQEKILGFFCYAHPLCFDEMGQSSLIVTLHGFK
jgi:hypothetical protein